MRGGECPVIPPVHSSVEVIEDTEDFIQFDGLYSPFPAVERFPSDWNKSLLLVMGASP